MAEIVLIESWDAYLTLSRVIPRTVHRGLMNVEVRWTCIDATDDWIAIGTDAEVLYMYDRNVKEMLVLQITQVLVHHDIIIYFENVIFFHAQLGLDVCPEIKPLHIFLKTACSGCNPSSFISTFSYQFVFIDFESFSIFAAHSKNISMVLLSWRATCGISCL